MAIELTDRDRQILNLMKEFHIMTVKDASIYFDGNNKTIVASRRLKKLYEAKNNINRYRPDVLSEYIFYYNKRRTNWKHDLYRLNVYTALQQNPNIEILKYKLEKEFIVKGNKARCDLLVVAKDKKTNTIKPIIIEIDLTRAYKKEKYQGLDYQQYFGNTKPLIISVGRYQPKDLNVMFVKIEDIDKLKELSF